MAKVLGCLPEQEAFPSLKGEQQCPLWSGCISGYRYIYTPSAPTRLHASSRLSCDPTDDLLEEKYVAAQAEIVAARLALLPLLTNLSLNFSASVTHTHTTWHRVHRGVLDQPPRPFPAPHTAEPFRQHRHQLRPDRR